MKLTITRIVALSEFGESYARSHGLKSLRDLEILEFVYKYPESTRTDVMLGVSYSSPWSRIRSLSALFNVEHSHTLTETGTSQYVVTLTEAGKRVVEDFANSIKGMRIEGNFDLVKEIE